MQFGMVPEDSTDEHGDSLLSSNPNNCAFDSNLFDASALDIDYCMSDEIDIDFNNDSGIVGARFKRADNKNLLGLGEQSNCTPPTGDTVTTSLTNGFFVWFRLQCVSGPAVCEEPDYQIVTTVGKFNDK